MNELPDIDSDGLPRIEVEIAGDGMRVETRHELIQVGHGSYRSTGGRDG